jgi:hypothetical protein
MDGQGSMTNADGSKYEGSFEKCLAHGTGISIEVNGDIYEGEFLNGNKHGKGKYTDKSGFRWGRWEDNNHI